MYAPLRPSLTQPSRLAKPLLAFCLLLVACLLIGSAVPLHGQTAPQAVSISVGGDNLTRLLWNNSDGSVSLWRINADNSVTTYTYGSFTGFTAASLAVDANNISHILWDHTSGSVSVWDVDNQGVQLGTFSDGPYSGWAGKALASGPDRKLRLMWDHQDGTMGLWNLSDPLPGASAYDYGPYSGFTAVGMAVGPNNTPFILWDHSSGSISLWNVNNGSNYNYGYAGPYGGYTAVALAVDASGSPRIVWNHPSDNTISLWKIAPNYSTDLHASATNIYYNDPPGFMPTALAGGSDGKLRLLWTKPDGTVQVWVLNGDGSYTAATYSPYVNGLRIDAGSSNPYVNGQGPRWAADYGFTNGTMATTGATVTGTLDPALYQTQRVETTAGASFSYTLSVPNGKYILGLSFAETSSGVGMGQRLFNVSANGAALLTGFDIFASAGGQNKAITQSFLVTVTNGLLPLVFTGTTGQAAVAAISVTAPGGTPAMDIPAPGWAEDVIPSDSSEAGGNGPSASESVSLPSGVKENHPGSDLDVFNPLGPSVSYTRMYRSALAGKGVYTPGLSPGWRDSYSLSVMATGGGGYTLNYPNGASENWATTGGGISPPAGTPYLVRASGGSLTMTFKDHSYYTFTPDPNNAANYLLTGLSNLAGGTVTISRDAANGSRITSLSNAAGPLLTLNYNGSFLSSITDVYSRTVTYGFTSSNLSTVSQVNAATVIRWQYSYQTINGQPFLNAVMVPDPSGGAMSEADTQYTSDGHVAWLQDGEGNQRVYSYGPQAATVSIYGADGTLAQTWTQNFDPANHNADKGVTDANGNSTNLVYGDAANPYKVTAATNKNGQTAYAAFDSHGNTIQATDLRGVQTQSGYDPAFPLGQITQIQAGTNQPTPKSPTNFTYYDGTTQVNGVTQPAGLVHTMSVPTPGTVGTGPQVTTTYTYTAMGNALTVTSPGPNVGGAGVTTIYNYTNDPSYDAYGNSGSYTAAESLGQPLTLTDPLGNVTHFRYDSRGNTVLVITPAVVSYPDTTTARGLRTDYAYNALDQLTSVVYPPLNQSFPTARASAVYTYQYVGGPLLGVTQNDENNNPVRQAMKGTGKEGEHKSQAGSVMQANLSYDPQYKLKQLVDGNNNAAQTYGYDAVGNLSSQTFAMGDGTQFTQYDADNNLIQMKDGRSITTTYTRAADDSRVTGVSHSDGTPSVTIGANGYDVYDRVTTWSDGAGSYTAAYDDDDNLLSKTTTYTGLPPVTVAYGYNNDGSMAAMTTPKSLSGGAYTYWTFGYTYDADGRLTRVTCPWPSIRGNTSLAKLNYYYDAGGRLLKLDTAKADTFYVYNARGFVVEQQEANLLPASSYNDPSTIENGHTGHPVTGTIPSQTAQGIFITGDTSYCLLADYSNMQYDSLGNRRRMDVLIPDFYFYVYDMMTGLNYLTYPPKAPDTDGILSYVYDNKDRLTLETTADPITGMPSFEDTTAQYNDNWNYTSGADLADNLTMLRGNTQSFNPNDQLMTETYDGEGNRTSYNGGTLIYDALNRPVSVSGGVTTFTQLFTGEGQRAWKLPNGGNKTYFLYDDAGHVLCELDSAGSPVNTYAYGSNGLVARFQHTDPSITYKVYLFDPSGNLAHRVRNIDPDPNAHSSGQLVLDTVIYDGQGLLHADIDAFTGGFEGQPGGQMDPVGYKGQSGNYTDLETLHTAAGTYTALSGPGGAIYYDPLTAVGMARSQADSINAYNAALNPFADWTFGAYAHEVGQFGIGESKGFANFGAQTLTLGLVSAPFAASNESQSNGAGTAGSIAFVGSFFIGGEAVAVEGGAAKILAGAESRAAISPIVQSQSSIIGQPTMVLGRKVYQNDALFTRGVPANVNRARVGASSPTILDRLDAGETNLDLMRTGNAPIGHDGLPVNLHHIIGAEPGPMIELPGSLHERLTRPLHSIVIDGRSFRQNPALKGAYGRYRGRYWRERAGG